MKMEYEYVTGKEKLTKVKREKNNAAMPQVQGH
jgi:hypothetical protein